MSDDTIVSVDYVWTDGYQEEVFHETEVKQARELRELRGQGKVWRREYDRYGGLCGITDVTFPAVISLKHGVSEP